jgi:prophage regulatory protein
MNQSVLLRMPDVIKRVGLSRSSIYAAIREGLFPAPISLLGKRSVAFHEHMVEEWISTRANVTKHLGETRRIRRKA